MSVKEAKTEVFWMAFKGLPKKERRSVVERLLKDVEFMEDLIDIAILEQRREEPSRPLEDYLAEIKDSSVLRSLFKEVSREGISPSTFKNSG